MEINEEDIDISFSYDRTTRGLKSSNENIFVRHIVCNVDREHVFVVVIGDLEFTFAARLHGVDGENDGFYAFGWRFLRFNALHSQIRTPPINTNDRERVESLYPIILAILRDYNQPVKRRPTLVVSIEENVFHFDEGGKLVASGLNQVH